MLGMTHGPVISTAFIIENYKLQIIESAVNRTVIEVSASLHNPMIEEPPDARPSKLVPELVSLSLINIKGL